MPDQNRADPSIIATSLCW